MRMIDELEKLGVNASEGMDRVMGDASLYEMMLGMFIDAVRDNPVNAEDFSAGDLDGLIKRVHMLKGVTGNLSMTPLFKGYTETLTLLRAGQPAEAKEKFEELLPVQAKIMDCIEQCRGA